MRNKNKIKTEAERILRGYFCVMFILICLTAAAVGSFMSANNTRAMSLGESETVLAAAQTDKRIDISVGEKSISIDTEKLNAAAKALTVFPAPISNLVSIGEAAVRTAKLMSE